MYVIELLSRGHPSHDTICIPIMLLLLLSVPLSFVVALVKLIDRVQRVYRELPGVTLSSILAPGIVVLVYGVYIVAFVSSPFPVAISGM